MGVRHLETSATRRLLMSRVRQHGTAPELLLRKALRDAGLHYRLKLSRPLPGRPDIIFAAHKLVVFVDGCFWHGCPIHGSKPKNNREFWETKLRRNQERDRAVDAALQANGWTVMRVWEHQTKRPAELCAVVNTILRHIGRK
ncbi:very short patch repair endonuclease [Burkholderia multivorans]|uniref:very short patch repair endonuclease n=1 Tax=Burkholderia multivorans TaxID=87883 RepID=UPI001C24363C|nr:very short patch repair endonuclease [Burkholderia multivorans]MBU9437285.1 very short patch repair endonuclease [Burkholderia multivorans]